MVLQLKRSLMLAFYFALIALAIIAPGASSAAPAQADGTAMSAALAAATSPDFLFSVSWRAPDYSGYLVRGGDSWVRYALQIYGWGYYTNHLRVVSFQGWTGTVNLEVLGLPAGVISEIPGSVFVPKSGSATVPIRFLAPASVPLSSATVTLRGTSGAKVKTASVAFEIVEQLPPLPK